MEMTNNKVINRIYQVLMVLFFATPFLFIFYGQLQQRMIGIDMQEVLETNPYLNVTFIASFVTPFIGFYMLRLKQAFEEGLSREVMLTNLGVIAVSFLIMGNVTYGLFVGILLYFMNFEWKIGFKGISRYYKQNGFNWKEWIAPVAVLLIAGLIRSMLMLISNV